MPKRRLIPAERPAAEQARDAVGGDGTELVDQDQGGQRLVLVVGGDGQEVLDDRGGDHRGQQRTAVSFQAEETTSRAWMEHSR